MSVRNGAIDPAGAQVQHGGCECASRRARQTSTPPQTPSLLDSASHDTWLRSRFGLCKKSMLRLGVLFMTCHALHHATHFEPTRAAGCKKAPLRRARCSPPGARAQGSMLEQCPSHTFVEHDVCVSSLKTKETHFPLVVSRSRLFRGLPSFLKVWN